MSLFARIQKRWIWQKNSAAKSFSLLLWNFNVQMRTRPKEKYCAVMVVGNIPPNLAVSLTKAWKMLVVIISCRSGWCTNPTCGAKSIPYFVRGIRWPVIGSVLRFSSGCSTFHSPGKDVDSQRVADLEVCENLRIAVSTGWLVVCCAQPEQLHLFQRFLRSWSAVARVQRQWTLTRSFETLLPICRGAPEASRRAVAEQDFSVESSSILSFEHVGHATSLSLVLDILEPTGGWWPSQSLAWFLIDPRVPASHCLVRNN